MANLIDRFLGMFSTDMGIDLGTCNTLVCVRGNGVLLCEPSVVAVRKGTNEVLMNGQAVGRVAKEMLGKTPGNIEAIRPMRDGVISDFDLTEAMIRYFIRKVHQERQWIRPRVAISHPSGINPVEKRALINSAERAGARQVYLVPEPIAAGIGAGLPFDSPTGCMIVDIGGGTTEVAVLSLGGVVASTSLRVAGDELDQAIMTHMKNAHNLLIGEQTAEKIKIQIGSASPNGAESHMDVRGLDISARMPRKVKVSSEEIRESFREPVLMMCRAIRETLDKTLPELAADLTDQGIVLAGGGALLRGLDEVIARETELPVRVCEEPLHAVVKGTGVILQNLDQLKETLESGDDLS